jgi:hypothetical protein
MPALVPAPAVSTVNYYGGAKPRVVTVFTSGNVVSVNVDDSRFTRIGHSLIGLCLALTAGMLCLFWIAQRQDRGPAAGRTNELKDLVQS